MWGEVWKYSDTLPAAMGEIRPASNALAGFTSTGEIKPVVSWPHPLALLVINYVKTLTAEFPFRVIIN